MSGTAATLARRLLTTLAAVPPAAVRRRTTRALAGAVAGIALAGCVDGAGTGPMAPVTAATSSQAAADCVNVSSEGNGTLGFVVLPNGTSGFGATWTPTTLGGIEGEMASVVLSQEQSGKGALHLTLEHAFRTAAGDWFITRDRAVCAPAGADPTTCRVNDVLTIVSGTGIFANATGSLRNTGVIDFVNGTLAISLRGRVCGDGL